MIRDRWWMTWDDKPSGASTAKQSRTKAKLAPCKKTWKKQERRIDLKEVRVSPMLTSERFTPPAKRPEPLLNREHPAASVAKSTTNPAPLSQRQLPARKHKKQADTTWPNQFSQGQD